MLICPSIANEPVSSFLLNTENEKMGIYACFFNWLMFCAVAELSIWRVRRLKLCVVAE